jgi:hypothetical protein
MKKSKEMIYQPRFASNAQMKEMVSNVVLVNLMRNAIIVVNSLPFEMDLSFTRAVTFATHIFAIFIYHNAKKMDQN